MTSDWDTERAELWASYNHDRADHEPRPLFRAALECVGEGDGRLAIDLGAGAGVETGELIRAGWRVLAIDADPTTIERIRGRGQRHPERLEVQCRTYADLTELPTADLLYSGYSLPYAPPQVFGQVWWAIRAALAPGGLLAVQLFGERDSMRQDGDPATFLSRDEAEALLEGLEIVAFDEQDDDGPSFTGPKHWHVFHLLARQPKGPATG